VSIPQTRFARSRDVDIAYQQFGAGERDIVLMPGWVTHIEVMWELAEGAHFLERLGRMGRVVLFDKRGTGMSDRPPRIATLEERVDDLRAVMDTAGVEHAFLIGWVDAGAVAVGFAATEPARVDGLVLGSFIATGAQLDDDTVALIADAIADGWGEGKAGPALAPSLADDPRFTRWFRKWERQSATPRAAAMMQDWALKLDLSDILGAVQAPSLVLHRRDAQLIDASIVRDTAARIPGATYTELPGADLFPFAGDSDALIDEVEEFITGTRPRVDRTRVLATALFTDIVGSTEHARSLGDHRWKTLLEAHHALVREQLERFDGREIDTAGDGFFATFDGPARAARCACSIRDAVHDLGLQIRAGVHTGEVELLGDDVAGIAVHVAARVSAAAGSDEVLVTQTVKDLVLGSGIEFADRGAHTLKGVPDEWRLYAVVSC